METFLRLLLRNGGVFLYLIVWVGQKSSWRRRLWGWGFWFRDWKSSHQPSFSSQSAWFVSAQWQPLFNISVNAVARTTLTVLTPNPNTTSLYISKNSQLKFHPSNRSTDVCRLFGWTYCRDALLSLTIPGQLGVYTCFPDILSLLWIVGFSLMLGPVLFVVIKM